MTRFKLPRAVSWPLTIQRGEAQLSAALAVVFDDQSLVLNELADELLGPTEFAYFSTQIGRSVSDRPICVDRYTNVYPLSAISSHW